MHTHQSNSFTLQTLKQKQIFSSTVCQIYYKCTRVNITETVFLKYCTIKRIKEAHVRHKDVISVSE
jgi:hypothetical protein